MEAAAKDKTEPKTWVPDGDNEPPVEPVPPADPAPATPEPEAPDSSQRIRTYVVLVQLAEDEGWEEVDSFDATTAEDAIRQAADKQDVESATYVAVPVRSWTPQLVKVEVKRTISVGA